jgi:CheY-like chemotaxis protein
MGTVLVVDDEYGIAGLIEALLTDEGHRVLTAANGRQGLEVLARERPDLVFLDYMMPVMDGAAMLRGMAEDSSLARIVVVMMSAVPESTMAERCSGYAKFLRKPFRIAEVLALAEELIRKDTTPSG